MDLETWLLQCIDKFRIIEVYDYFYVDRNDQKIKNPSIHTEGICKNNYEEIFKEYKDSYVLHTFIAKMEDEDPPYDEYFGVWDKNENTGYVFKTQSESSYFFWEILGSEEPIEEIQTQYPELIRKCDNCNCYNDYLLNRFCKNKMENAEIFRME